MSKGDRERTPNRSAVSLKCSLIGLQLKLSQSRSYLPKHTSGSKLIETGGIFATSLLRKFARAFLHELRI